MAARKPRSEPAAPPPDPPAVARRRAKAKGDPADKVSATPKRKPRAKRPPALAAPRTVQVAAYERAARLPVRLRRDTNRIPQAWVDDYLASLQAGEEQLSLRDEIALVDAMVGEVLEQIGKAATLPISQDPDVMQAQAALGARHRSTLALLMEQRRKLVETEQRNRHMLAAEVVQSILRRTVDVLGAHVADRAVLQAVARDLRGILAEFRLSTAQMVAGDDVGAG